MTVERINEMLGNYRAFLGRCKHLETEIKEKKRQLEILKNEAIAEAAAPNAQNLDGMPHGTTVSSKVEKIAVMFADGYTPDYIQEAAKELRLLEDEYSEKSPTVEFVDAWLIGLTERERWIIEQQIIDSVTWREIIVMYEKQFGEYRTKDGLKKLKSRAMEKIYSMAL